VVVDGASCVQLASTATLVVINEPNMAHIDLPANATHSLLCFTVSPTINVVYLNSTTKIVLASASLRTDATIQSAALADPSLINKVTGQPFGGKIVATALSRFGDSFALPGQQSAVKSSIDSRECVMGLLSLATLQARYGLSLAQARAVFATPMTVTLSESGGIQNVSSIQWVVGFRLFGD
jgi:protein-disulfide isomerase-like protein with CxxC motif